MLSFSRRERQGRKLRRPVRDLGRVGGGGEPGRPVQEADGGVDFCIWLRALPCCRPCRGRARRGGTRRRRGWRRAGAGPSAGRTRRTRRAPLNGRLLGCGRLWRGCDRRGRSRGRPRGCRRSPAWPSEPSCRTSSARRPARHPKAHPRRQARTRHPPGVLAPVPANIRMRHLEARRHRLVQWREGKGAIADDQRDRIRPERPCRDRDRAMQAKAPAASAGGTATEAGEGGAPECPTVRGSVAWLRPGLGLADPRPELSRALGWAGGAHAAKHYVDSESPHRSRHGSFGNYVAAVRRAVGTRDSG